MPIIGKFLNVPPLATQGDTKQQESLFAPCLANIFRFPASTIYSAIVLCLLLQCYGNNQGARNFCRGFPTKWGWSL